MIKKYVDQEVFDSVIKKVISSKSTWYGVHITRYLGLDGKIYVMEFNGDQIPSTRYYVEEEI